jgi:hypothetical protein
MRRFCITLLCCSVLSLGCMYGQSTDSDNPAPPQAPAPKPKSDDGGRVGVGVKVSPLGVGVEVAGKVIRYVNVRAGFNVLGFSRSFNKDDVDYSAHLDFRTVEAHVDVFPWAKSFHVSPGILAYIGTPVTASAVVGANQSFTLNSVTYYSDPSNPATPNGKVNFNSVSPTLTVGWGNLVKRDHSHISIPVEFGVAFQGAPKTTLAVGGYVCEPAQGENCVPASSNSTVQTNIVGEQTKINNSLSVFKFYPIASVGFGYTF